MLGTFQQSQLRIELAASEKAIAQSLLRPDMLKQWMWWQRFSEGLPEVLTEGTTFTSWLGPVAIAHRVEQVGDNHLRLLMSQGIDGYQDWRWGDGWVQSDLAGVSLLPLSLGQTASLTQLRQYLDRQK